MGFHVNVKHFSAICCLLTAATCGSGGPVVQPTYQQVAAYTAPRVQCTFGHRLADCQIRVSEHYYHRYDVLLDFSRGARSERVKLEDRGLFAQTHAKYYGIGGLGSGSCGVQVDNVMAGTVLVECFGRTESGIWSQGYGLLACTERKVHPWNGTNVPLMVQDPGSTVSISLPSSAPWKGCEVKTPDAGLLAVTQSQSVPSGSRYLPYQLDLARGQCGFQLPDLRETDSGVWSWYAETSQSAVWQMALVTVKVAPQGYPSLTVHNGSALLKAGDTISASCSAPPAAPPVTMTWLLGSKVVRRNDLNDTLAMDLESIRPWQARPVQQTFTRALTARDSGKVLQCRIEHPALSGSISVEYPLRSIAPGQPMEAATSSGSTSCSPIVEASLDIHCDLEGEPVNCTEPMAKGTVAHMKCREAYVFSEYPGYNSVTCNDAYSWSDPVIRCIPDCGKRNPGGGQQLVSHGTEVTVGEFSWHVGVYRLNTSQLYGQICGATLVTPSLVMSAAHCFWDTKNGKVLDKAPYKLAAGKYHREWYVEDPETQKRDVAEFFVHQRFNGHKQYLAHDIAMVKTTEPFELTWAINVICIDWLMDLEDAHLTRGNNGTVAGWGITELNKESPILKWVTLPFVPYIHCGNVVEADFLKYLTPDKLCGGWLDRGISICPGDSGGGYVFPQTTRRGQRYFLQGIASAGHVSRVTGVKCHSQQLAVFTQISMHQAWVEKIVFNKTKKFETGD